MSNTIDLINSLQAGDDEATQSVFNAVMASKVTDALNAKRIEVASSMYNNTNIGDQVDVDVQTNDVEPLGSEE